MRTIDHVILLHGVGASPHFAWFPWLRNRLMKRGIRVDAPVLPHPFRPDFAEWKRAARPVLRRAGRTTLVIGHSLGGTLAARLLAEGATTHVGGVALVAAPVARTIAVEQVAPFFDATVDWRALERATDQLLVIHAKNDPVVPYDHAVRFGEALGVRPILVAGGGHFAGPSNPALWTRIEPMLRQASKE